MKADQPCVIRGTSHQSHDHEKMKHMVLGILVSGATGRVISSACRDDSYAAKVRRTQENGPVREHWEPCVGWVSPGTGRKNPPGRIFRPVPGLANWQPEPTAVRRGLVSFALRALVPGTLVRRGLVSFALRALVPGTLVRRGLVSFALRALVPGTLVRLAAF
jgi:hypothetical protein